MSAWVTVALESIVRLPAVVEWQEASTIIASTLISTIPVTLERYRQRSKTFLSFSFSPLSLSLSQVGMRNFHWRKTLDWCPIINVDKLWTLVSAETRAQSKAATGKSGAAVPVIDVTRVGFHKVLGKGFLPQQPFIVRAKLFSKKAERKIQAAGGVCELTA